jgi:hypothetical protein
MSAATKVPLKEKAETKVEAAMKVEAVPPKVESILDSAENGVSIHDVAKVAAEAAEKVESGVTPNVSEENGVISAETEGSKVKA